MSYEFNRNDVYGFARTISTDVKEKGNELFFKYCPYCHGGGKDKDTFSINLDNGTFKCFRSSCSKQGHFVELARDFGYKLDFGETVKPKVFRRLPQKGIQTADKAVTYLVEKPQNCITLQFKKIMTIFWFFRSTMKKTNWYL